MDNKIKSYMKIDEIEKHVQNPSFRNPKRIFKVNQNIL